MALFGVFKRADCAPIILKIDVSFAINRMPPFQGLYLQIWFLL